MTVFCFMFSGSLNSSGLAIDGGYDIIRSAGQPQCVWPILLILFGSLNWLSSGQLTVGLWSCTDQLS